ncbi:MAG: hypothetical protein WBF87_15315 [Mesorhizobium sp.]
MADKPTQNPSDARAERLKAQLRANLQRRKAQARARREGEADERSEGIPAVPKEETLK